MISACVCVWLFSPHTRGCSSARYRGAPGGGVFPAYAGMFRFWLSVFAFIHGFPRIRGDVPLRKSYLTASEMFSPHTRGCSAGKAVCSFSVAVFPAYAGMFRISYHPASVPASFPRIRGDVPCIRYIGYLIVVFSPHTRGCSFMACTGGRRHVVFPAYAGMFRANSIHHQLKPRFPRIRGDVPTRVDQPRARFRFSPHTRGCSAP